MLASGSSDETIRVWDIANGTQLKCLQGHQDSVNVVLFDRSDKMLISGSGDKAIRFWDVKSGQCLKVMEMNEVIYENRIVLSVITNESDDSVEQVLSVAIGGVFVCYNIQTTQQGSIDCKLKRVIGNEHKLSFFNANITNATIDQDQLQIIKQF